MLEVSSVSGWFELSRWLFVLLISSRIKPTELAAFNGPSKLISLNQGSKIVDIASNLIFSTSWKRL